jgi:hypothetical protein
VALIANIGSLLLALCVGDDAAPRSAAAILLASLHDGRFAPHELADRLASLPPQEVPALFEILERGGVPQPRGETVELDEWRLEAVRGAFGSLSSTAVRAHVQSLEGRPAPEARRETAVLVLGEMGMRQDILLLVRVAAPADPARPIALPLQQAATDALARILARDERAIWALRDAYDQCHEGLLASFPRAVRAARPAEGLQILTDLLGRAPAADALVLAEIGHFGEGVEGVVDPMVLEDVRSYLGRADARLVQGAALAVRKLDDTRAVPDLLRLLRHADGNVRRSADLALQRITDRDFRADVIRWESWYAQQVRWWATEASLLMTHLEAGDKAVIACALNELSTRRIFRDELAEPLVGVLFHPDPGLAGLACSVAGKLRLRSAVPELMDLTDHPDPTVAGAARGALRRIRLPDGGPLSVRH